MKKRNGKKIGWITGLLVIVMIVGVILSWESVWASDQIPSYTIKLDKGSEGVEITASNSSGEKTRTETTDSEGEAVFHNFFEVGEEYTITVKLSPRTDYYVKRAQIEKGETEVNEIPIKIGEKNSYSLQIKADMDQSISIVLDRKKKKSLSELESVSLQDQGQGSESCSEDEEKEKGIFIYNHKTDAVKVKMEGAAEVGYKSGEDVRLFENAPSFEIQSTTVMEELYIKGEGTEEWTVYQLSPPASIVIDKNAPVVTTVADEDIDEEEDKISIYTNTADELRKLNFKVENEEIGSKIAEVYYYEKGKEEEPKKLFEDESVSNYTISIPTKEKTTSYYFCVRDKAGNESKKTITVYFDNMPPDLKSLQMTTEEGAEIAYDENATKSWKKITLKVEAEDNISGVDKIILKTTDKKEIEERAENGKVSFTLEQDDQINSIICKDRVGNEKEYNEFSEIDPKVKGEIKSGVVRIGDTDIAVTPNLIWATGVVEKDAIFPIGGTGTKEDPHMISIASDTEKQLVISVEEAKARMGIASIQLKKAGEDTFLSEPWNYPGHPDLITQTDGDAEAPNLPLEDLSLKEGDNKFEIVVKMAGGQEILSYLVIRLDTKCPEIEKIEIRDAATDTPLQTTKFGKIYTNRAVKVVVTAKDESDIKSMSLYNGEDLLIGSKQPTGGKKGDQSFSTEFIIDVENQSKKDYSLKAAAVDMVGNECTEPDPADAGPFMIEKIEPVSTVNPPAAVYGGIWYAGDVEFTVTVQDADAGLKKVVADLNGKQVKESDYESTWVSEDHFTVSTKEAEQAKDGSYTLRVTVTDNAGNTKATSKKIWADTKNPEIVSFEFDAEGYREGEKTDFGVDQRDYGYYFKEKTKVTVRAKDASPSSGLQSIHYYTVDKDGGKSEVKTEMVSSSGSITFDIPANFKGQIYAKPTDHVNHSPKEYVTPDSAVIENAARHKKDSAITITRAKISKKDAKGQDLYKKDVAVTIKVSDRYSGIRKIEYSVIAPYDTERNQKGTIEIDHKGEKKQGSAAGWERTGKEKNLVTELTGKLTVSNNSNDIVLTVKMTDRAGHTSTQRDKFDIDKTNPVIHISYDNNKADKEFPSFYKKQRTATVVVTERNFNAKLVNYTASNQDGEAPLIDLTESSTWKKRENKKNPDQTTYTAKIPFTEDGKYTWDLSLKDRAGNAVGKVRTQKFTIDQTEPLITVTYDNENAENVYYYKENRLATITIEEHNFEESRIKMDGKSRNDGKAIAFPSVSAWLHDGDTHTATILYEQDAEYFFQISYTDQAGNEALAPPEDHFVIDKILPEINITGVENKSANQGKVIPIVTYTDVNLDAATLNLSLQGVNRGEVEVQGEEQPIKNGSMFTFKDFEKKREMDDIYTLAVSVEDKAGNKSMERKISFSVNRFGSTYRFEEPLTPVVAETQKGSCRYLQNEFDVVLKEINVDELQKETPKIRMLKNGTSIDLIEGQDYTVKHDGGGEKWSKKTWSEYTYEIDSSNFSTDGMYEVEVSSRDDAGNKNENMDENKKASIQFAIDKTEPVIIPIDIEKDTQYPLDEKEVKIAVKDNMVTPDVKIYLNEREVQCKIEGEDYVLTIPSDSVKQNLKIVANDLAGNSKTAVVGDFLVSTNLFVRWYNNLPLFAGTLAGFGMLVVLVIVLIVVRNMRRKETR